MVYADIFPQPYWASRSFLSNDWHLIPAAEVIALKRLLQGASWR
jgi:hypothetical protein